MLVITLVCSVCGPLVQVITLNANEVSIGLIARVTHVVHKTTDRLKLRECVTAIGRPKRRRSEQTSSRCHHRSGRSSSQHTSRTSTQEDPEEAPLIC